MIRESTYQFLCVLFRMLAYLADCTHGAALFVRPKLIIGGVIVALGSSIPENGIAQTHDLQKSESVKNSAIEHKEDSILLNDDVLCYLIVEKMPEFPGGQEMQMSYLAKNISYPKTAINKRIEGMLVCKFVILEDGSVTDVKVIKKLHPLLDKEAVRVIKTLPKWHPGKQVEKPVRCNYSLPIKFSLPLEKQ